MIHPKHQFDDVYDHGFSGKAGRRLFQGSNMSLIGTTEQLCLCLIGSRRQTLPYFDSASVKAIGDFGSQIVKVQNCNPISSAVSLQASDVL